MNRPELRQMLALAAAALLASAGWLALTVVAPAVFIA